MIDSRSASKRWFIAFVIYILVTFGLSMIPSKKMINLSHYRADLLLHAIEYGFMAWLIMRWLEIRNTNFLTVKAGWTALIISVVVGGINELLQFNTPGRYPSVSDEIANAIGAAIVIWIYNWLYNRKNKSTSN